MNFQDFFLAFHFVSIAVFAAVLGAEFLTLSLAVWTYALDLLDHAWSNLLHSNLESFTFTGRALLQGTFLAAITCNQQKKSLFNLRQIFHEFY